MKKLKNKISIITGSTQGIGEVAAKIFSKEGSTVIITGRNELKGKNVRDKILQDGGICEYIRADATKNQEVKTLVDKVVEQFGRVDVLYNNAGYFYFEPPLHKLTEEAWDEIINVNLKSVFLFSKYVIPIMIKNGGGTIINTSSVQGKTGYENLTGYNTAKAGIINLTRSMAVSYAYASIRVNCICPGPLYSFAYEKSNLKKNPKVEYENWKHIIPLGRLGRQEEVARVALFLASTDSSYITGEYITIDGGLTCKSWDAIATEKSQMIKYSS